jgi:uncharacterized protein (TIGR02147 family)
MDTIFKYSDYRKYIRDYVEYMKTELPYFSYRTISARAGINSSGFYSLIVQGKRDLTNSTIQKTCVALDLKGKDALYFEQLVLFNQAPSLKLKNQYFEELFSILNQQKSAKIEENQYDIFSAWYHSAIRELTVCRDFKNDFRTLGRMLKPEITEKQARESVELLIRLGFLKFENGTYSQSAPIISIGPDIKSHHVLNYQISFLKLAIEAFDRFGPDDLISNSSTTFRISKETYELFKRKNREHRQELLEIASQDQQADLVYQLTMNMFPLSTLKSKKKSS